MKKSVPGICVFGFLPLLKFFLPLSIPPFSFSWHSGRILWFCRIFCTFLDVLLSTFAGLYHKSSCGQSMPWLPFSVLFWRLWECAGLYMVGYLFLLFLCGILLVLPENSAIYGNGFLLLYVRLGFPHHSKLVIGL